MTLIVGANVQAAEEKRFKKGQSGNPRGRPKKIEAPQSDFRVLFEETVTIERNGKPVELSIDEALQLKTLQEAFAGNKKARREVTKMIIKREKARAAVIDWRPPAEFHHHDFLPSNASEALRLLGLASDHEYIPPPPPEEKRSCASAIGALGCPVGVETRQVR